MATHEFEEEDLELEEDQEISPRTRGRRRPRQPVVRHCLPALHYFEGGPQNHLSLPMSSRSSVQFDLKPQATPRSVRPVFAPFLEEFETEREAFRWNQPAPAAEERSSAYEALLEAAAETEMQAIAQAAFLGGDVPEVIWDLEEHTQELEFMQRGIIGSHPRGIRQLGLRSGLLTPPPKDTMELVYRCESVMRKRRLKIKKHKWRKARKARRRSNA